MADKPDAERAEQKAPEPPPERKPADRELSRAELEALRHKLRRKFH